MLEPLSIRLFIRAPLAAGRTLFGWRRQVTSGLAVVPWLHRTPNGGMDHKITFYRSTGAPPTQRHYGFAAWALSHWASDWAPSRYLDPVSVHTHEAG